MSAMLRLAARDRSSFLLKKFGHPNGDHTPTKSKSTVDNHDNDDGPLPTISPVDTEFFIDLFTRFSSSEETVSDPSGRTDSNTRTLTGSAAAAAAAAAAASSSSPSARRPASARLNSPSNLAVVRNDSTGSSSTTLSMRSNHFSAATLHSSASSFTEPPSPGLDRKESLRRRSVSLEGMDKSRSAPGSTSLVPKNLNKPLPPIQTGTHMDFLPPNRAELESAQSSAQPANDGSRYRHTSRRQRSMSLPRAAELASVVQVAELPSTSTPHNISQRAARGSAMLPGRPMQRPRSLLLASELDCGPRLARRRQSRLEGARSKSTRVPASRAPPTTRQPAASLISASAAESIIYRIMYHLTEIKDLQSAALVSKGFMNTFKRNETTLVSHLMYQASKPAWELRRNLLLLRGMKDFYLKEYMLDLQIIKGLKALILDRCHPSLHPKAIAGLSGNDRQCEVEVDNALWRIWSFCLLFTEQSHNPLAGLNWLNGRKAPGGKAGGAEGAQAGICGSNGESVNMDQLDNMMGMWLCLQSLLYQFHGGRQDEAYKAGVFDNWYPELGWTREEHLREWTAYLVSLGPNIVFSLCSGVFFDCAKSLGLTEWPLPPPGHTRSNFLVSAITHIRQERERERAGKELPRLPKAEGALPPLSTPAPGLSNHFSTPTLQTPLRLDTLVTHHRHMPQVAPNQYPPPAMIPPPAAPIEIRPDCDPELDRQPPNRKSAFFPATTSNDPTMFHTLTTTATTASAKLGATLFPVTYTNRPSHLPASAGSSVHYVGQTIQYQHEEVKQEEDVVDPVDQHLNLLVHQLGFDEAKAKRALAKSDTGSGIDVLRAIEILLIEKRQQHEEPTTTVPSTPVELPTPITSLPNNDTTPKMKAHSHVSNSAAYDTHFYHPMGAAATTATTLPADGRQKRDNLNHSPDSNFGGKKKRTQAADEQNNKQLSKQSTREDIPPMLNRKQLDVVSLSPSVPLLSSIRSMRTGKMWRVFGPRRS